MDQFFHLKTSEKAPNMVRESGLFQLYRLSVSNDLPVTCVSSALCLTCTIYKMTASAVVCVVVDDFSGHNYVVLYMHFYVVFLPINLSEMNPSVLMELLMSLNLILTSSLYTSQ